MTTHLASTPKKNAPNAWVKITAGLLLAVMVPACSAPASAPDIPSPPITLSPEAQADIDRDLIAAAAAGDLARLDDALANGASSAARSDVLADATALHLAAFRGHTAIAQRLIEVGAAVDARTPEDAVPWAGRTPLMLAASSGQAETVVALLAGGANGALRDTDLHAALFHAIDGGNAEVTAALLNAESDPNQRDAEGMTALHQAAAQPGDRLDLVNLLLGAGADPAQAAGGTTALLLAEAVGNTQVAARLRPVTP